MTEKDKRMELPKMSLDDLFTIQGERDAKETIVAIPINEIDDFPNHPYKVKDDDKMLEMSENIKRYGVTQPVIVRQKDNGRFEMISATTNPSTRSLFQISPVTATKISPRKWNIYSDNP